jgi:TetR/AcrR family transcriptional repressor of bet genes
MPKLGMEPIRRAALVNATIEEIGHAGTLSVTMGQIAKRAGVSPALAHHYFGNKEQILLAAMRHILTLYGRAVREALAGAEGPRGRLSAIVGASFAEGQFRAEVIGAWLNFYVQAQSNPAANRLLNVYQRRLRSNLRAVLRPLMAEGVEAGAETLAALIDGIYIRAALTSDNPDGAEAVARVMSTADLLIEAHR